MYSRQPKALETYPVIVGHPPLNSTCIHTGAAQLNSLCQQDRPEPNANGQNTDEATILAYATWQKIQPNIQASQAKLLASAGSVTLKIYDLPLPLIINIANFLCPSNDQDKSNPGKPLEWLLISTLYRQIHSANLQKSSPQDEIPQNKAIDDTHLSLVESMETTLIEAVIRKSEHAVIVTAARIAGKLTRENAQHLILISKAGTSAQKTATLYYLLEALRQQYCICKLSCELQNQEHKNSYSETRRYFYFITGYYEPWFKALEEITHAQNSLEYSLVDSYPRYFSCARETLNDYKPQAPKSGLTSWLRSWWK